MNEQALVTPPEDELETTVQETARHFVYPPTPDIVSNLRQRREHGLRPASHLWRVAAAVVLVLVVVTVTVPEVRAFVLEIIRIGAVRIFLIEPSATPTATSLPSATSTGRATSASTPRPTRTPLPTPVVLNSVLELPGETVLATAQSAMNNRILLPAYPADIGVPDHVFIQVMNAPLVTLVWTMPGAPEQVRLSLEVLDNDLVANKLFPVEGQRKTVLVNGRRAEWLADVHEVWYFGGGTEFRRLVGTPVLIWQDANGLLTYRLEADLPLDEAIRVAESLGSESTVH